MLTRRRCNSLADIASRTPGLACQGCVGSFLDGYLVAEALASKLQSYYLTDLGLPPSDKIQVNQLIAAHKRFLLQFDDLRTRSIFLSTAHKSDAKSCRQLRNGYLHSLNAADRKEIEERSNSLIAELADYVSAHAQLCSVTTTP